MCVCVCVCVFPNISFDTRTYTHMHTHALTHRLYEEKNQYQARRFAHSFTILKQDNAAGTLVHSAFAHLHGDTGGGAAGTTTATTTTTMGGGGGGTHVAEHTGHTHAAHTHALAHPHALHVQGGDGGDGVHAHMQGRRNDGAEAEAEAEAEDVNVVDMQVEDMHTRHAPTRAGTLGSARGDGGHARAAEAMDQGADHVWEQRGDAFGAEVISPGSSSSTLFTTRTMDPPALG